MAFQFIRGKRAFWLMGLCGILGALLAFSFIPFSRNLISQILAFSSFKPFPPLAQSFLKDFGFIILAFLLFFSLPSRPSLRPYSYNNRRLFLLSLLPLLISFGFGFRKPLIIGSIPLSSFPMKEALWAWVLIPLGEELLFRGWITRLLDRLFPQSFLTLAPFCPVSLWGSAFAFAFWHLQNLEPNNSLFVLFQLSYAFMVGVWLGFLKWQTQKLWPCILAHSLLNFVADWKLWFVVL